MTALKFSVPEKAQIAKYALLAFAFSIPFSSALFRISLLILCTIFLFDVLHFLRTLQRKKLPTAKDFVNEYRLLYLPILLTCWIFLSGLWSIASHDLYIYEATRYLKLLMIPILAYLQLMYYSDNYLNIIKVFLLGAFILMCPTLLDAAGLFNYLHLDATSLMNDNYVNSSAHGANLVYIRNHIVHGLMVSILCATTIVFWLTNKNKGITTLLILIACLSDILFFITGRMALIGLFASLFLLVYQVNIKNSHKLIFTLLILLVALSVVTYSQGIQTRLLSIYFECKDFFINANSDTSGGNRLHYWGIASNFIASHPFIGMGAGSFRQFLIDTNDTIALNNSYTHMHSHNEYLTIFSLYGAIGLTIFLLMLRELYTNINLFQSNTVRYSCFIALSLILFNALTDSSINNQWEGWTFVLYASFVSANVLDKCKSESAAP